MLGKLVKHDLRFRYKKLLIYSIALIITGILLLIFEQVSKTLNGKSLESLMDFYTFYFVLYLAILFVFPLFMFADAVNDFNSRYFRDQSYLTHTLPVTTSKLVSARLISDILMALGTIAAMIISVLFARQSLNSLAETEIGFKQSDYTFSIEKTLWIMEEITYYTTLIIIILAILWFIYTANAFSNLIIKVKALTFVLVGGALFVYLNVFTFTMNSIDNLIFKATLNIRYKEYTLELISYIDELLTCLFWVATVLIIRLVLKQLFKKKLNIV